MNDRHFDSKRGAIRPEIGNLLQRNVTIGPAERQELESSDRRDESLRPDFVQNVERVFQGDAADFAEAGF